jgi:SAM-dependent methyltransferase
VHRAEGDDLADGRDERDRELFDRVADDYTRKDEVQSSRLARRLRLDQTFDAIGPARPVDVLEIGCGAGFATDYGRGRIRSYVGIDQSPELIALARRHHDSPGVEFAVRSVHELDAPESADVVLMIGVLHHLSDVDGALKRIVETLRPGGWLVANEPSPSNPLIHAARLVRKRVDRSYSSEQEEFTAAELRSFYERAGLRDVTITAQGFFSSPFAEVPLPFQRLTAPIAALAVRCDRWIGRHTSPWMERIAWNLVAAGRR